MTKLSVLGLVLRTVNNQNCGPKLNFTDDLAYLRTVTDYITLHHLHGRISSIKGGHPRDMRCQKRLQIYSSENLYGRV